MLVLLLVVGLGLRVAEQHVSKAPWLSPGVATRGRKVVQADVADDWLSSAGQSVEQQCAAQLPEPPLIASG